MYGSNFKGDVAICTNECDAGKCARILVSVAAVVAPPMYALLLFLAFSLFPMSRLAMETFESPLCTSYRERGEVWYNASIVPVYTHSRTRIRERVSYVDCCRGATTAAAVAVAERLFAFFYSKFTLLCLWFVPSWCALELGPLRRTRYSETSVPEPGQMISDYNIDFSLCLLLFHASHGYAKARLTTPHL
uniref:Uncharacterized protein n=1 Tax=Trichogramma kaykai TaxID=54128 RepID=A0ABD2W1P7_9HYME